MAQIDVKITDLDTFDSNRIKESDILLLASSLGANSTFNNVTCQFQTFVDYILNLNRNVDAKWIFKVTVENPSMQSTRFDISDFREKIISNEVNLNDMLELNGTGFYYNNNVLFPPNILKKTYNGINSKDISQFSVANLDYANRIFGYLYNTLSNKITSAFNSTFNNSTFLKSNVGDIIFSKDLSTENQVRSVYGNGEIITSFDNRIQIQTIDTKWIQHGKYVLTGAKENVVKNNNNKTGGEETCKLALPEHNHIVTAHNHTVDASATVNSGKWITYFSTGSATKAAVGEDKTAKNIIKSMAGKTVTAKSTTSVSFNDVSVPTMESGNADKNSTINVMQPTMFFYIWERIA